MFYKMALLGSPGTSKSTMGLSFPGVEMHEWGSSEYTTAAGFIGRTDILPPLKLDWYETLTEPERAKFTDEKVSELDIAQLTKVARARNVARYRRYLYSLKADLLGGKRTEVKTLLLDNLTPFSQEFSDYIETVWAKDFITKDGNFDTIAYYKRYVEELSDFIRLFMSLPCHTVLTCHVGMAASEEIAANTPFMQAAKMGGVKKEWSPLLTGRVRHMLAGLVDWCFFLRVEETAGQPTKYVAKLEADEANVGVAKPRVNPYANPRRLLYTKGKFYDEFSAALDSYLKTGVLV